MWVTINIQAKQDVDAGRNSSAAVKAFVKPRDVKLMVLKLLGTVDQGRKHLFNGWKVVGLSLDNSSKRLKEYANMYSSSEVGAEMGGFK
ncbi:hypothetical protein Tco_0864386 [Tanacetum coccineum]